MLENALREVGHFSVVNRSFYMKEQVDVLFDAEQLNKQASYWAVLIVLASIGLYYAIWGFKFDITFIALLKFYFFNLLGLVIHEMIHGLGFILIGKAKLNEVKFGVIWKAVTPYAHCKVPLGINAYRISLLLPVIITGIIPLILGLAMESLLTVVVAAFLTTGGIGDWLIFRRLQPFPSHAFVSDHPSEIGCIVEV